MIGIYIVNQVGLGDFIAITPLLRKLHYIFGQKITIFGYPQYEEFLKNNPYVDNLFIHGNYDTEILKNYEIYNVFDNWNEYYYYDLRQLCAKSFGIFLKDTEMDYDYYPNDYIKIDLPEKYVCLNPYTSGPDRSWEIEKWQELVDKLKDNGIPVVTIGRGDNNNKNGPFFHLNIKLGIDLCGDERQNDLSQTWHIINNSMCFISFDCGMYIFAGTTNTHIIQLGWYGDHYFHAPVRNGKRFQKYSCVRGNCHLFCLTDPRIDFITHGNIKTRHPVWTCVLNTNFNCKPNVEQVYSEVIKLI